ncbi:MAG: sodium:solute symporter family protein [Bacteroidota bacterium]
MTMQSAVIASIGIYMLLLLILGIWASRLRKSNSLKDFYLAGGGLGSFVLLLTLYATQYSANTMLVVPAEVVNKGMGMIMVLGYMTAIVVFYLAFAPQLYRVSKREQFITPGDWFDFRFQMPALTLLANIVLLVVSINFLLAQLMAMGHIAEGITGGQIPYWAGVVFLAVVVILYETLGGMQAVAWTDVIQGLMMLIGLGGLFVIVIGGDTQITDVSEWLLEHQPEKIQVPSGEFRIYWASTVLMVGMGAAVYPQVIQRIYASRSIKVLKQSLGAMVFMPLVTVLILFLLGILSIPHFAEAESVASDAVLPQMLEIWSQHSPLALVFAVMMVVGLLAATMSTADSVLLSLSSIVAQDILGKSVMKTVPEERLTTIGKLVSWLVMASMVIWALQPQITLWGLIELKMQILVQIVPLFLLGLHDQRFDGYAALAGLCAGLFIALTGFFFGIKTIGGIQLGLIGFGLNMIISIGIANMRGR